MRNLTKAFLSGGHKVRIEIVRHDRFAYIDVYVDGVDVSEDYLNRRQKINHRLRSDRSIDSEIISIYESYKRHICDNIHTYVITNKTYTVKNRGNYVLLDGRFVDLNNINSATSGQCLSWHMHDVYNSSGDITINAIRNNKGVVEYYADETELYDFKKLQKLSDRIDRDGKRFSFFFYEELNRLVGKSYTNSKLKSMSGLF